MMVGRLASARATATRCCWPPESSLGRWDSRSRRPTVSMTVSIHSRSPLRPPSESGRLMFSSAVSVGTRLNDWKMKPTSDRRSSVSFLSLKSARRVSPMNASPDVRRSSPAMQCMRVDFPEPLGPMIAVKRALPNSTVTSWRAVTAASPSP